MDVSHSAKMVHSIRLGAMVIATALTGQLGAGLNCPAQLFLQGWDMHINGMKTLGMIIGSW